MAIINNLYVLLGMLLVVVIVLQSGHYSFKKKMAILFIFSLILLWIEKPDWFIRLIPRIRFR